MKNNSLRNTFSAALLGFGLAMTTGQAQDTNWLQKFDTASSLTPWNVWWGTVTLSHSATEDADANSASGSLLYDAPFVGAAGEQFMTFAGFHYGWQWDNSTVLDGTKYTNLSFSVKIPEGTAIAKNGTGYGQLEVGFLNPAWQSSGIPIGWYTIPLTATNWTRVKLPIDPTKNGLSSIAGIYIKMWSNGSHTNSFKALIDNLEVELVPSDVIVPPPTLALQKTTPGLQLISTTAGGANARYNARTGSGYSWINAPTPTTYSITIKDYPRPFSTFPYFQTHMFLTPSGSLPWGPGDSAVDWNSTNLIFLNLQSNPNGSGFARFMWKTNVAGGGWGSNPQQVWGVNTVTLESGSILGKWSLTFSNNTNVTLSGPGGAVTNFALPASAIPWFTDPNGMYCYIGMQPNGAGNVGQASVIENIKITGAVEGSGAASVEIDDSFTYSPLNTEIWSVAANDANGVQVVAQDTPFWLTWTLPDSGFSLEWSPDEGTSGWFDPFLTPIQIGALKRVLIPNWLSWTNTAFFRLTNAVTATNSLNVVSYQTFDLAPGKTTVKVPSLKQSAYQISAIIPQAPELSYVVTPESTNTFGTNGFWSAPNALLGPNGTYDFYNLSNNIWPVTFAGEVVKGAPVILVQPANVTVIQGDDVVLESYAGGTSPITLQWRLHGTNLVGSTGNRLVLNNVTTAMAGPYSVQAVGSSTVESSNGVLTVSSPAGTLGAAITNGVLAISITGVNGRSYVLQSNAGFTPGDWTPVITNAAPFIYTTPADSAPKYYRAVYTIE